MKRPLRSLRVALDEQSRRGSSPDTTNPLHSLSGEPDKIIEESEELFRLREDLIGRIETLLANDGGEEFDRTAMELLLERLRRMSQTPVLSSINPQTSALWQIAQVDADRSGRSTFRSRPPRSLRLTSRRAS